MNNFENSRAIDKSKVKKYSPSSQATANKINTTIDITVPLEDCSKRLLNCHSSLQFEFLRDTDDALYAEKYLDLENLRPLAVFSEAELT